MARERSRNALGPTVSQTVGPFFHIGLGWLFGRPVAPADAAGRHVTVHGRVLDGDGAPVPDAVIEVWQADANGEYPQATNAQHGPAKTDFGGYARLPTDAEGWFRFSTVVPGRVPAPDGGMQAPHVLVAVFMRGLLRHLVTRLYFFGEPANDQDLVLLGVPADRRSTLLAKPKADEPGVFAWNIVLQGPDETVFFDY